MYLLTTAIKKNNKSYC